MAKGQRSAAGEMEKVLERLAKLDIMDKKLDRLEQIQKSQEELKLEIATIKKDLGDVQQLSAENKKKVEGLEGDVQASQRRDEARGKVMLGFQMDKMSYFLRFQNLEEVDQENLRDVMINLLAEYTGRSLEFMSWDIDQVYRVNSQYAIVHGVPREVHVKFVKRETRDEILRKQRSGALTYRGREVTILKQIPRQVRDMRRKYYFLANRLYQKGIGFRWLMPEGLLIFQEGNRIKISSVAEASAYADAHKTLLDPDLTGMEEGEVSEDRGPGVGGAAVTQGLEQAEARVLRSRAKK